MGANPANTGNGRLGGSNRSDTGCEIRGANVQPALSGQALAHEPSIYATWHKLGQPAIELPSLARFYA